MRFLAPLAHPKIGVVLLLGFSSGLPYLLVGGTLGVWLRESGMDLSTVGMFAWVSIPYSFNFLWAPLIDQLPIPWLTRRLGKRRSWMLLSQCLLLLALALLGVMNPQLSLPLMAMLAVIAAFCSASQDITIDAYRTEYLDESQYQDGAAMAVLGYRLGVLVAGAGALALADLDGINWSQVYFIMAAFMLVGIITCLCMSEPNHEKTEDSLHEKGWIRFAMIEPFKHFAVQHKAWIWILLLIFTYRLPDGFIGFISYAFYVDVGFSKSEIAGIVKLFGLCATLVGAFAGAICLRYFSLWQCLVGFLLFQMLANLCYIGFSVFGAHIPYLMLTITLDNLSGGMITAAAITYMMLLCDKRFTATQYALLSSLASLASKTLSGGAGYVAEHYGWSDMFALSALLGLPALCLLCAIKPLKASIARGGQRSKS